MIYFVLLSILAAVCPIREDSKQLFEAMKNFQRDVSQKDMEQNYASFINMLKPALIGPARPAPIQTTEMEPESMEKARALACSKLICDKGRGIAICACNFNTGKVVSFKNECDLRKHNCRFETDFKVILQEVCPWEFSSRRLTAFNYSDPKYFNNV